MPTSDRKADLHHYLRTARDALLCAAGLRADNDNMAPGDASWWNDYRSRLERLAREAGRSSTDQ